jgi:hypothetical protein
MATALIYPTEDYHHILTAPGTESTWRDYESSDTIRNNLTLIIGSQTPPRTYIRSYIEFDISGLNASSIDSITFYATHLASTGTVAGTRIFAMYAGSGSLSDTDNTQFSLYLQHGHPFDPPNGPVKIEWGMIDNISAKLTTLMSCSLDLTEYPVLPAHGRFVIGLVSTADYQNTIPTGEIRIISSSNAPTDRPYVTINYTSAGGYANQIMGVTATSVMGVPAGNIANIMGV